MRDFRLVGRVAGEEFAALDQMVDARRDMVAIGAAAEEEGRFARDQILPRQRAKLPLDRHFRRMHRQVDRPVEPRRLRHVAEQIVDRLGADRGEHARAVVVAQGQITHLFTASS